MNKKRIYIGIFIIICILLILVFTNYFFRKEDKTIIATVGNTYTNEGKMQNLELNNIENKIVNIIQTNNEIVQKQEKKETAKESIVDSTNKVKKETDATTNITTKIQKTDADKNAKIDNTSSKKINNTHTQTNTTITSNIQESTKTNTANSNENVISKKEENSKLANTHFTKYNAAKTKHAVNYINAKMKQDELYSTLGGKAVVVSTKPTDFWFSYSKDSKLDGVCMAGTTVKVYVVDEYSYNSKGTEYYLYDTKAYIYQET
jgi:hypothetical protein